MSSNFFGNPVEFDRDSGFKDFSPQPIAENGKPIESAQSAPKDFAPVSVGSVTTTEPTETPEPQQPVTETPQTPVTETPQQPVTVTPQTPAPPTTPAPPSQPATPSATSSVSAEKGDSPKSQSETSSPTSSSSEKTSAGSTKQPAKAKDQ